MPLVSSAKSLPVALNPSNSPIDIAIHSELAQATEPA
jgi:hypothetical protein